MTHDERTGKPILPKDQLEDGAYYIGRCRNASVARWSAEHQVFVHWREKMGSIFTETIKHPVDELHFDVFRVLRKIDESPFEIPIDFNRQVDGAWIWSKAKYEGTPEQLRLFSNEVWCQCTETVRCIHCKFLDREKEAS